MRLTAIFLALLLTACSGSSDPAAGSGSSETPAATPAPPPAPKLDTAEVQGVVDAWLAAQNGGDFDAYSAQYAGKFFGIKRSGPRVYRYARDGWLTDRKRMFRKQMKVEADNVEISAGTSMATVRFVQTWASGSYKDVGPKQLIVVRDGGALKIAREEMLASTLVDEPAGEVNESVIELGWTEDLFDDGRTWVLINDAGADAAGPLNLVSSGGPAMVTRKVPAEAAGGYLGGGVQLVGGDAPCAGRLVDPIVVSRFEPHFGQVQFWDEESVSQGQLAEEIWEMGPHQLWFRFEPGVAGCSGTWAVDAGVAALQVYSEVTPDAALVARAIEAFRARPGYRRVQDEYDNWEHEVEGPRGARWEDYDGDSPPSVQLFEHAASGRRVVVADASSGWGCGSWEGAYWVVWTLKGDTLKPAFDLDSTKHYAWAIQGVLDVTGDGVPELQLDDLVIDAQGERIIDAAVPSYDCPC